MAAPPLSYMYTTDVRAKRESQQRYAEVEGMPVDDGGRDQKRLSSV